MHLMNTRAVNKTDGKGDSDSDSVTAVRTVRADMLTPNPALRSAYRKVSLFVLPTLCLLYFVSWLDRQNVSFAKLQMREDLGMTESSFGLATSAFFVGYAIFAVPIGMIIRSLGVRHTFAMMMSVWGIATVAMAARPSEPMLCILRFVIGALESGFAPGVFYFLSLWAAFDQRTRYTSLFIGAGMIANAVGAPICSSLLDMDGVAGMRGWQWLFIVTGAPAILLGLAIPWLLTECPKNAKFLLESEKSALEATLIAERSRSSNDGSTPTRPFRRVLFERRLVGVAFVLFGCNSSAFGLAYWLPTVIQGFGVSNLTNGMLNSVPWLTALVALYGLPLIGHRTGRWALCSSLPLLAASVALLAAVIVPSNTVRLILLSIAAGGIFGPSGILAGLPSVFLNKADAAPALAAVGSFAILGAFVSQNAIPAIFTIMGSVLMPMLLLSAVLCLTSVGAFIISKAILSDRSRSDA